MKAKAFFTAILLPAAMLLGSCANTTNLPRNTETPVTDSAPETQVEETAEPFASLRSSKEE